MKMIYNQLADGNTEEIYVEQPLTLSKKISNLLHPGIYCVRRCGFYKGSYSIHKKEDMVEWGEYFPTAKKQGTVNTISEYNRLFGIEVEEEDTGDCNGLPWVAWEGAYSQCKDFIKQNQTYVHFDRH
jgi:hypothetical protein